MIYCIQLPWIQGLKNGFLAETGIIAWNLLKLPELPSCLIPSPVSGIRNQMPCIYQTACRPDILMCGDITDIWIAASCRTRCTDPVLPSQPRYVSQSAGQLFKHLRALATIFLRIEKKDDFQQQINLFCFRKLLRIVAYVSQS